MCVLTSMAQAQRTQPTPVKVYVEEAKPMTVASRNNLYCAGYVQSSPIDTANKLVGGVEEQEQFLYAENDIVYLNMGSNKGIHVGDVMAVVRPRGKVETRWTKKDDLGFYVQEVGAVEVIRVKNDVSVAPGKNVLRQPTAWRSSPAGAGPHKSDAQYQRAAGSVRRSFGKGRGPCIYGTRRPGSRYRDQIVYVDLGADDNVQVGDHLTVFRPLGAGHLFISDEDKRP